MREWRKTHKLMGVPRQKDNSRSYAATYKKRGKLVQQPCEVCASSESQMHHPDHEHPLVITWLCRSCHLDWHMFWRNTVLDLFIVWVDRNRKLIQSDGPNVRHETLDKVA